MSSKRIFVIFLTLIIAISFSKIASARIYIPIDQPIDQKFPIAIAKLVNLGGGGGSAKNKIPKIIGNDLELTGYFSVVPESRHADSSKNISADTIDFSKWTKIGARAVVKGAIDRVDGKTVIILKLFDPKDREMLVGKQYTYESEHLREIAHRFSDEIMLALTGIRGVFGTKIAFAGITGKRRKNIFYMDLDGENVKKVTKDRSISLGPDWSPDGRDLVYTSYVNGFPEIYKYSLDSKKIIQLTANQATNVAPDWSPTGAWIAYSSSVGGNMEIYLMTPSGENNRRITNSFGIDVSPSFSPDGNEIIYTSERGGSVQLYKQPLTGGKPERATFVGGHNDSADWSPDGEKVIFCGLVGGLNEVFSVNIDGTRAQRLTISTGNNEHPRWSPDGRFIVFSSSRFGKSQTFMMRYDGAHQICLNKKIKAVTPSWGPWEY